MPSLDDIEIIQKLSAAAADDVVPVTDVDSTASSKVKHIPVALVGQGFTHAFVVNYDNATVAAQTTADTDETVSLISIPQNSFVDKVRVIVPTAFAGTTALNIFVGRGGTGSDPDGYIASLDATSITGAQNTGALIDTDIESDVVTAADATLDITFDPAVLASITEIADYANLTTATA